MRLVMGPVYALVVVIFLLFGLPPHRRTARVRARLCSRCGSKIDGAHAQQGPHFDPDHDTWMA